MGDHGGSGGVKSRMMKTGFAHKEGTLAGDLERAIYKYEHEHGETFGDDTIENLGYRVDLRTLKKDVTRRGGYTVKQFVHFRYVDADGQTQISDGGKTRRWAGLDLDQDIVSRLAARYKSASKSRQKAVKTRVLNAHPEFRTLKEYRAARKEEERERQLKRVEAAWAAVRRDKARQSKRK